MPSSVQGFLWTWPILALYGLGHSQRQSLSLLSQGQKHLRNTMCPGQTPKTYVRDEKWTWTSRQTNWSRLSCPYAALCATRTSCQEPSQTPESSPSGDTNLPHISSLFCDWPCWATVSPQREVWGVGYLLTSFIEASAMERTQTGADGDNW